MASRAHPHGMVMNAMLRLLTLVLVDAFWLVLPKHRASNRVGIVRLDALGDFVIWLPSATDLIQNLQREGYAVTLVANTLWADWAAQLFDSCQVVPVDPNQISRSFRDRLRTLMRVRRLGLGTVIVPTYSRLTGDGNDALSFASGAHTRVTSQGYRSRHRMAGWLRGIINLGYTRILRPQTRVKPDGRGHVSEFLTNEAFNRAFGVPSTARVAQLPRLSGPPASCRLPERYVAMIPGGSWSGKTWPVQRFVELARRVAGTGATIVACGTRREFDLCAELIEQVGGVNLAGVTSIPELVEVLRHADLVIGNDSAGIHLSAAVGTAAVCVMWGGSFGRFLPYPDGLLRQGTSSRVVAKPLPCFGCTGACPYPLSQGKVQCIDQIDLDTVWQEVEPLLIRHVHSPLSIRSRPAVPGTTGLA